MPPMSLESPEKPKRWRLKTIKPEILGSFISRRRKKLGMTQKAFGEAVSLTQNWVSQIETAGKIPDLSTIKRIMKGLKIRNFAICYTKKSKYFHVFQIHSDELVG